MGWARTWVKVSRSAPGKNHRFQWINLFPLKTKPNQTSKPFPRPCSGLSSGQGGSWTQTHWHVLGSKLDEVGPLNATRWDFPNRGRDKSSAELHTGKSPAGLSGSGARGAAHPRGPGGAEAELLAHAGDAFPALCRAGLGYGAGAGKAPPQVAGGLRNSSPIQCPVNHN